MLSFSDQIAHSALAAPRAAASAAHAAALRIGTASGRDAGPSPTSELAVRETAYILPGRRPATRKPQAPGLHAGFATTTSECDESAPVPVGPVGSDSVTANTYERTACHAPPVFGGIRHEMLKAEHVRSTTASSIGAGGSSAGGGAAPGAPGGDGGGGDGEQPQVEMTGFDAFESSSFPTAVSAAPCSHTEYCAPGSRPCTTAEQPPQHDGDASASVSGGWTTGEPEASLRTKVAR